MLITINLQHLYSILTKNKEKFLEAVDQHLGKFMKLILRGKVCLEKKNCLI